jgi:hypothetical protein
MLEVACSAARVDSFALAGQCFGAQAIFELSTDVRCRGVAFILFDDPRYILPQPGAATAPVTTEQPRQPGWKRALRSVPALRPLLLRVRVLRARRIPWPAEFVRLAASTPSLFLLLRPTARVGEIERAIRVLGRMASAPSGSLAVRAIDHRGALTRMPRGTQERMLDEVAEWLDATLPPAQPSLAHTDQAVLAAANAE